MKNKAFNGLLNFLKELELKDIEYELAHQRDEAIMVLVALPGERWEIEFFADGNVEVEKFNSSGEIFGAEVFNELSEWYSEVTQEQLLAN